MRYLKGSKFSLQKMSECLKHFVSILISIAALNLIFLNNGFYLNVFKEISVMIFAFGPVSISYEFLVDHLYSNGYIIIHSQHNLTSTCQWYRLDSITHPVRAKDL